MNPKDRKNSRLSKQCLVLSGSLAIAVVCLSGCGEGLFGQGFERSFSDSGRYIVVSGDTVYGISRRTGVPVRVIIEDNGIQPPYLLRVGQTLRLSAEQTHMVVSGDTAYSIAKRYRVSLPSLGARNNLGSDYTLRTGQVLVIPGAGTEAPVAVASTPTTTVQPNQDRSPYPSSQTSGSQTATEGSYASYSPVTSSAPATVSPPAEAAPVGPAPTRSGSFQWPLSGAILAGYGEVGSKIKNDGINIAAAQGAEIKAAENGVVAYVGNEIRGYGNLILIKHANDFLTAYAHLDRPDVTRGQQVRKGQTIGRAGSTGGMARPQLHFEIRKNGKPVDPLPYLKGQKIASAR